MSDYNHNADQAERQLKNISKTMCYAKWAQSSIHLTNGMTHSCYHPPLHKVKVEDIIRNPKALHNTEQKKLERSLMLKGQRPEGCSYCWKIEDIGGRSDRVYRSGEYWAQNARRDIFEVLDKDDIDPRYLEVNFNQVCNFKCMYCSPHLSSTWEDEIKQHGPYKILSNEHQETWHNDINHLEKMGLMPARIKQNDNIYIEAFWQWWPSLYKKLEVFRITGGEPLMDANTFKVLDYIYENPNTWLEVSVTSNLCPAKPELFQKFIDKLIKLEKIQIWQDKERFNPGSGNHWYVNMALKNFALFVSLDSVGKQAEYIRHGLNYDLLQKNVLEFLSKTNNTTVTFINTFNALSIPKIKEYLTYILDLRSQFSRDNQGVKSIPIYDPNHKHPDHQIYPRQRIWFDVPVLRNPSWQNIQILPKEFQMFLVEAINFMKEHSDVDNFVGFYDFEIEKMERNLTYFNQQSLTDENLIVNRKNFYNYFRQYDSRKNLNFNKTFPELAGFYNSCQQL